MGSFVTKAIVLIICGIVVQYLLFCSFIRKNALILFVLSCSVLIRKDNDLLVSSWKVFFILNLNSIILILFIYFTVV